MINRPRFSLLLALCFATCLFSGLVTLRHCDEAPLSPEWRGWQGAVEGGQVVAGLALLLYGLWRLSRQMNASVCPVVRKSLPDEALDPYIMGAMFLVAAGLLYAYVLALRLVGVADILGFAAALVFHHGYWWLAYPGKEKH